jgi:ABC-type transport system involved in cytochrome c biogenesis permease component
MHFYLIIILCLPSGLGRPNEDEVLRMSVKVVWIATFVSFQL